MKHVLLIAIVVVCTAASGCAGGGALTVQDKAAIQKLHDDYAQAMNAGKNGDPAVVTTMYAQDAQVLMPNIPAVTGTDAIAKASAAGPSAKNFKFSDIVIDGNGDVAIARGTYEGDWATPGGVLAHEKGKFVDTLKKQADGSWKVTYDIWNSDAPAAALPVPTGQPNADASGEVKALAGLAGTWKLELELKDSPVSKPGKVTLVQDCRWLANGLHMMCATEGAMPPGPYHDIMVFGHDPEAKVYKGYDVDNSAMSPFTMTFKDNQWTWNYEFKMGGKPAKMRTTIYGGTRDGWSARQELSTGGAWTLCSEGKATRIGG